MFVFNLDYSITMPGTAMANFGILEPTYNALLELNRSSGEPK